MTTTQIIGDERLHVGLDGFIHFEKGDNIRARMRARNDDGRWRLYGIEVWVWSGSLSSALRSIPVGRIENFCQLPEAVSCLKGTYRVPPSNAELRGS